MAQSAGAWGRRGAWRRLFSRDRLVRHPVSVMRRRLGNALLALLVLLFGLYTFRTRDEAIRRSAIQFFEKVAPAGVEIRIGRASFEMFDGITLRDVRVAVPYDADLNPEARSLEERAIFSAASLKLIHNPWHLLLGHLRVERVVAVRPTIFLVYNAETGLRNWQLLARAAKKRPSLRPRYRPVVTLRSAQAVVTRIEKDGPLPPIEERLDADVRPHPQSETGYYIEVRRYGDPVERTTMLFDPGERLVANTPFVSAQTIRLQLPRPAQKLFDALSLSGEVRLSRLLYDAAAPEERVTDIELRRVQCDLPLSVLSRDDSGPQPAGGPRVLRMSNVEGELKLRGERLALNIGGVVNGARCRVEGSFDQIDNGLKEVGVGLRITATGMPTPEGAVRRGLLADADLPRGLRKFLDNYDPHGRFDMDLHFARAAGAPGTMRMTGTIRPRGVSGRARWFPYPLEDVFGLVRFEREDVFLEGLRGRHGSGAIRLSGRIDRRTRHVGVELDIGASAVPLDGDLHAALAERYRSVWDRFSVQGRANIHARLSRAGYAEGAPKPAWDNRITIDLIESRACLPSYAHAVEDLHGRLEVAADRIDIEGLAGRCAGASVRINGTAVLAAAARPEVDLRLAAEGLRLDAALGAALPAEGGAIFAQFQPQGRVDLAGRLLMDAGAADLLWDMRADVSKARVRYEHFPYPVEDVQGTILLRPDRLSILDVRGRHGETTITAGGEVRRRPGGYEADLSLDAGEVVLDAELHDALPPALKAVWDLFEPGGRARIRTGLHIEETDGRRQRRHRTEIEPIDARLRFREFPLPLSSVRGRVLATHRRVEIVSLCGEWGGGTIELSGEIDLSGPGKRGTLAVFGTGLRFDDELMAAMPSALRGLLRSMRPKGRFDLQLDPLCFEIGDDGRTRWDFDGRLHLADARLRLGFDIRGGAGDVVFRGSVDAAGRLLLEATADLERAIMAGWHVEHVRARVSKRAEEARVHIDDARAELYGGEATAFAEIDLGRGHSDYQASFTVRDIRLSRYLAVHRKAGPPPPEHERRETARGSISGNFMLRGRTGKGGYREGAGEVFVSEAQIWKLPIIFALFQVLNLTPDENVFHDGRLRFFLSGQTLTFQKIDLQGKAVAFVGGGRMDLPSRQLDVTLLAGSPLRIRIPLLTDLLEGASREMMEIRITGTLEKPDMRPQPLKSLTTALKTLFPEAPGRRGNRE